MNSSPIEVARPFEVRYESMYPSGRSLVFSCDAKGHVDLNALPSRALCNYLFARAMVGREFMTPVLSCKAADSAQVSL